MTFENLKRIADGGLLLVLVFVIYIIWDIAKKFTTVVGNHMEHDIEIRKEEIEAKGQLSGTLTELITLIRNGKLK